jgi:hypothetical protein
MIVDPIALGLVASIARPGGNITGVAIAAGLELLENVWGCWSRRCQNCPPSVTLHRDHSGKIREVWQRKRRPWAPIVIHRAIPVKFAGYSSWSFFFKNELVKDIPNQF